MNEHTLDQLLASSPQSCPLVRPTLAASLELQASLRQRFRDSPLDGFGKPVDTVGPACRAMVVIAARPGAGAAAVMAKVPRLMQC